MGIDELLAVLAEDCFLSVLLVTQHAAVDSQHCGTRDLCTDACYQDLVTMDRWDAVVPFVSQEGWWLAAETPQALLLMFATHHSLTAG